MTKGEEAEGEVGPKVEEDKFGILVMSCEDVPRFKKKVEIKVFLLS